MGTRLRRAPASLQDFYSFPSNLDATITRSALCFPVFAPASPFTVDTACCSTLLWLMVGLAFIAAELGITLLLVSRSTKGTRDLQQHP